MNKKYVFLSVAIFFVLVFTGCFNNEKLALLGSPTNFKLEEISSSDVVLSWDVEYGALGYVLYISTTKSISDASKLKVGLTNAVNITNLKSYTNYSFWVKGVTYAGEGELSNRLDVRTLIGAPNELKMEIDGNNINLTWDSVLNADSYTIYYSTNSSIDNSISPKTVSATSEEKCSYVLEAVAEEDGVYYAWVFGAKGNQLSTYSKSAMIRKGSPNYKFFIDSAPDESNDEEVLTETAENTEVFLIKTNVDKSEIEASKTGGVRLNSQANKKNYPVFSVNPNLISRSADESVSLDSTKPIRLDHKLSKEFNSFDLKKVTPRNNSVNRSLLQEYKSYSVNNEKYFWIDDVNGKFEKRKATLRAEGIYSYIWVLDDVYSDSSTSKTDNKLTTAQAKAIAEKFDDIYGPETNIFGETYKSFYEKEVNLNEQGYIVPEEKISILVLDIYDDYSAIQSSGIVGYFWNKDFFEDEILYEEYGMHSNNSEIFYIDSHFLDAYEEIVYSTLAHEFQHMLNCVNKTIKHEKTTGTWYNEMLSMVCEDLLSNVIGIDTSNGPQSRLTTFNSSYYLNGVNDWYDGDATFYSYAHAYAFGAFITRNYGGAELIKAIMENDKVDIESILEGINTTNGTNYAFYEILKEFARALCYPEGFEGTESDTETALGKANKEGLKHFYREYSGTVNGYDYTLSPIRLSDYTFMYMDINDNLKYSYGPLYIGVNEQCNLRQYGISVHSFGLKSGEFTFDYVAPYNKNVKSYFVIQ